jgi:hypothetical protein
MRVMRKCRCALAPECLVIPVEDAVSLDFCLNSALACLPSPRLYQVFELIHKFTDVFEFQIHRSESNVRHLVEPFQTRHDHLSNL